LGPKTTPSELAIASGSPDDDKTISWLDTRSISQLCPTCGCILIAPTSATTRGIGKLLVNEAEAALVRRIFAGFRGLLRQPEVVLSAWRAARASAPDITQDDARLALERLDPLWEELFPAEQARIIHLLVDRVEIEAGGADVRLKLEGLASLARDLATPPVEAARSAA